MWHVQSGRCVATYDVVEPVSAVAFRPDFGTCIVAAACGCVVRLIPVNYGRELDRTSAMSTLRLVEGGEVTPAAEGDSPGAWTRHGDYLTITTKVNEDSKANFVAQYSC